MSKADFDTLMGALADDPDLMGSVLGRSYSIWENTHMVFAMIVADKFNLTENETSIKEELEKKYHVFVVDDDDVDAGNFNFEVCNGVLVSTSVTDMTKINKLTTLPVICITRNPEVALTIFRMGSDAGGAGVSWGEAATETQINIIDNSHQILLDEALGANTVYTEAGRMGWVRTADLVADVYRLAEIVGDATKTVIAVLPFEGTDQDGNLAPQNRIFFGLREYHVYNGDALEHFYAMIDWLGHEMELITKIEALEKSKIIQDMLGRGNFVKTRNLYDYLVTGTTGSAPFEVISEYETRSVMERLEWIKNGLRRGTGTILPLNTSLYDYLLAVEGKLDVPANFMADVSALALEATLNTHDTDIKALLATIAGYIDTEIIAIETKLDSPANFMADVSALALEATLSTHDTDIKTLIAALNDISDADVWNFVTRTLTAHAFPFTNPGAALDVSNIRTAAYPLLTNGTYGLSALNTDLDKILTGVIQGTGTVLPANKSLYDILWTDRYLDEKGSFNWDTSAFTTVEQDVSALFTTALTGTKRREYQVYLDLSIVEGDANFDECYIRVYVKINGTYQCIDKATKTKANLQAEPGVPIEVPMTAEDAKITLQMKTALAVDRSIGYSWVQKKMEY